MFMDVVAWKKLLFIQPAADAAILER